MQAHTQQERTLCTVISQPRQRNSHRLTSSVRALSQTRQGSFMWIRRCTSFFELELTATITFFFCTGGVTLVSSSKSAVGAVSMLLPAFSLANASLSFVPLLLSAAVTGAFGAAFLNHMSSVFDCFAGGDARSFFTLPDAVFSVEIDQGKPHSIHKHERVEIMSIIVECKQYLRASASSGSLPHQVSSQPPSLQLFSAERTVFLSTGPSQFLVHKRCDAGRALHLRRRHFLPPICAVPPKLKWQIK